MGMPTLQFWSGVKIYRWGHLLAVLLDWNYCNIVFYETDIDERLCAGYNGGAMRDCISLT